jgi:hypothetical protein
MRARLLLSIFLILGLANLCFPQSRETGAILGTVSDDRMSPLPGVSITLAGKKLMGIRSFITDAQGSFRFPALPPGEYALRAELAGFKTAVQDNIRLTTTVSLTVDLVLEQASVSEEVTVLAKAPTVDVKSTETASVTLSDEVLRNIPYSQLSVDIADLAPGVNNQVAYGSSQVTGIASSLDGVNVSDPMGGGSWVLLDHNIIEEAKIMGVGLPAEYGNFTGVIFNIVTKSGGNVLSGHFEFDFQGLDTDKPKGLWQTANNGAYIGDFPELTSPRRRMLDGSAHLGGPLKKDKIWFYTGAQWYETWTYPTGFPLPADSIQPRIFGKITSQLTPSLNLTTWLERDIYNVDDALGGATTSPEATAVLKSPEAVANFSLIKILSPRTFFNLKSSFFSSYIKYEPKAGLDAVCRREISNSNYKTGSSGSLMRVDVNRLQLNAGVTHYAEDFIEGDHDFKFGAELERSIARLQFGYTGPNHTVYWDYYGEPYVAYQYEGYDTNTRYTRVEGFVQDAWQVTKRLNINAGLRLGQNWGTIKNVSGVVYSAARLSPRLGFAYDLLGDRSTVLKAHYGQFAEAMLTSFHDRLNPASAYNDFVGYYWDGAAWVEFDRIVHENLYRMDPKIKHPYLDQFTVSLERELFKDASFSVSYISRDWKNLISYYDVKSDYQKIALDVPELDRSIEVYERTSGSAREYVLANVGPGDPWILGRYYRKYRGVEFLFNKRFSSRWQVLASYVWSKAWGTADNRWVADIGWNFHDNLSPADPNYWTNADGNSTYDPTHMIKVQGTYIIPRVEVALNFYFRGISGNPWTTRYRSPLLAQGRVIVFAEPRGSRRYGMQNILDIRLEKIFNIGGKYRLGFLADVFNVFNADSITNWGTLLSSDYSLDPGEYPSTGGHALYGIINPRQARLGVRLIF